MPSSWLSLSMSFSKHFQSPMLSLMDMVSFMSTCETLLRHHGNFSTASSHQLLIWVLWWLSGSLLWFFLLLIDHYYHLFLYVYGKLNCYQQLAQEWSLYRNEMSHICLLFYAIKFIFSSLHHQHIYFSFLCLVVLQVHMFSNIDISRGVFFHSTGFLDEFLERHNLILSFL